MSAPGERPAQPAAAADARRLEAFPAETAAVRELVARIDWGDVLETVNEVIIVLATESGRILHANAAACRMFGYSSDVLPQQTIAALADGVPPHTGDELRRWAARARTEGPQLFEWRARTSDGRRFWVEGTIYAGQGAATGRSYVTLRDISARKAHEAECERADQTLRQSEERFRLLLGRMPTVAVQGCGADGLVRYWNEASERLYGYTAAEALGRSLLGLIVPPALHAEMRVALHQMVASGQPLPPAEVQLVHKDGRLVTALSSYAILNLPGADTEVYRLDFDLSERKQAENERLELERRLLHRQNLESLGVLAGGIAHDFNNLLTGVLGNLELARLELGSGSPTIPLLDDAITATRLAGGLTQQMLAYAGHARPQPRQVDLNTLIEEQRPLLHSAVAGHGALRFQLEPGLPEAEADPTQVAQVLLNLVTNAAESIRGESGTVEVRTGFEPHCTAERLAASRLIEKPAPQPFVYLEVADTGCGMDAATAQRVLDPFFSTKFAGRGLGLPVVFGLVRAHHGALFIDSQSGRGSVVRVLLPLARRPAAAPPETLPASPLRGTLLIIDDEDSVRRIVQRMGQRLGLDVIAAADAESGAALGRLHAGAIVCSVIDYTMPDATGLDCLRTLRDIQPGIPALLCSGCISPELAETAQAAGFDWVLQKPFSFEQFTEAVQQTCRRTSAF